MILTDRSLAAIEEKVMRRQCPAVELRLQYCFDVSVVIISTRFVVAVRDAAGI